jgi:hypothetical protein
MMSDTEVCTVWATEPEHHVRLARARDAARGLLRTDAGSGAGPASADDRVEAWHATARQWATRWREELMTPAPGTLCAPAEIPVDDSVGG